MDHAAWERLPVRERVAQSAAEFERRWSMLALRYVDGVLHKRLLDQRAYYHEALFLGDEQDIALHGYSLARGWGQAIDRMEEANVPHDAYMIGEHGSVAVAIGPIAGPRVREIGNRRMVWLTPDEVAAMFAGTQSLAKIQELWPDAEVVRVVEKYPDEPAKED